MDFSHSVEYLLSLGNEVSTMKLGLENIRTLLVALGDPQKRYIKVQVAGTNGKGSVCAFLDSICREAGIETGVFTSPHLVSITERTRVNGADIGEDEFAWAATLVRETSESLIANGDLETVPTYFEQVTAIALVAFAKAKVKLAILETGMGGRYDATTAANAEIAAITRIDLDHQEYLGDTIGEIAAEKAAIIHKDSKVIIGEQLEKAMSVLVDHCQQFGIAPTTACESFIGAIDMLNGSAVVGYRTENDLYHDPNLGLKGRHQIENARIAVMVAEVLKFELGFNVSRDAVFDGLENARHPGRLEYVGKYLFDGAHNLGGAKALAEYLDEFESRHITIIFGAMCDKDVSEITDILFPKAGNIILTQPDNSRAMTADELALYAPDSHFLTQTVTEAMAKADEITGSNSIVLVTGSLYLVGEVKKLLQDKAKVQI